MYRRMLVFGTVALLMVLPGAPAWGDHPVTCGMEVQHDIVLTQDLDCPGGGVALRVVSSGVTVDLGGHTITGDGTIAIFGDFDVTDIVIRNGTIQGVHQAAFLGFTTGAVVEDLEVLDVTHSWAVEAGQDTTITNSHFERTRVAVSLFYGARGVVRDSTFVDNRIGVSLYEGHGHVVTRNRFTDHEWSGVLLGEGGIVRDSVVSRNHFTGNGFGMHWIGELWTTGIEVTDNRFFRNRHSGVLVQALRDGDVFEGSVIAGNHLDRNGSEPLEMRVAVGDDEQTFVAADGLTIVAPSEAASHVTVAGNHAFHNAGFGIHAPGVTDGGRNHARHNGAAAQCVGVDCTRGEGG